ncbi:hypothetical protein Tco_0945814 [Tanacetum coccineum]
MVCLFNIVSTRPNIYFKLSKLTLEINAYKNNVVNGEDVDGLSGGDHVVDAAWSISTSNIHSVIAALSSAVSLLGGEYNDALRQKMREPNIGAKLFLGGVGVQKTGIDIATALNNMDVSSEYALKLRHDIEEQCAEV